MVGFKRLIHRLGGQSSDARRQRSAYGLLFTIRHRGPIRLADLATACYIDASTASRQVAELVSDGLIERQADPHDGRASLLALTDKGEQAIQELIRRRDAFYTAALSDWNADDIRQLADLLERLNRDLDEQADSDVPGSTPDTNDSRKVTT
ncbi:MAG TPA: MarR family transcriptional regulator [Nocardioidaceae bacterium]|nr:MarR family transcriptional regulator [Nocardioidaceae bacterium]